MYILFGAANESPVCIYFVFEISTRKSFFFFFACSLFSFLSASYLGSYIRKKILVEFTSDDRERFASPSEWRSFLRNSRVRLSRFFLIRIEKTRLDRASGEPDTLSRQNDNKNRVLFLGTNCRMSNEIFHVKREIEKNNGKRRPRDFAEDKKLFFASKWISGILSQSRNTLEFWARSRSGRFEWNFHTHKSTRVS